MKRSMFAFVAAVGMLAFGGCSSLGGDERCGAPEESVVQVYDDAAPAACAQAPAALECDPCTGQCAVRPQARVAAPAVVGEYGYVLGPPGAREQFGSIVSVPPETLKCVADTGHKVVVDVLEGAQCVLTSLWPKPPAPSQRLARLERVQRPPAARARVYQRATDCGRPMPSPQPGPQPTPTPTPTPDGEPPPSIPAAMETPAPIAAILARISIGTPVADAAAAVGQRGHQFVPGNPSTARWSVNVGGVRATIFVTLDAAFNVTGKGWF